VKVTIYLCESCAKEMEVSVDPGLGDPNASCYKCRNTPVYPFIFVANWVDEREDNKHLSWWTRLVKG
jgi:hypothetical protein